jgi:hypothetical protein
VIVAHASLQAAHRDMWAQLEHLDGMAAGHPRTARPAIGPAPCPRSNLGQKCYRKAYVRPLEGAC